MTTSTDTDAPRGTAPLLWARNVSKSYGAVKALTDVSLRLEAGEIHGLCGHNGAGKSTLMRLLVGLQQPDSGTIELAGEAISVRNPLQAQAKGIAIVDQELSLAPDLSVEENIFLGTLGLPRFSRPGSLRRRAHDLLERVGLAKLDPRRLVDDLSMGERQLVEIARLLGRDARVLILDEPTATLSEAEIELVFATIRQVVGQGKSVIFVSHRLDEVMSLCDRVTVFRDGRLIDTRSTADIGHSRELIRMMIGADLPEPAHANLDESPGLTVEVRGLSAPPRVANFDLVAQGGRIVGLTGQVGSGTTEVLRALAGLVPEARGSVTIDGRAVALGIPERARRGGIAFASNDRKAEGLFLRQSVRRNLVATRLPAVSRLGIVRRGLVGRTAAAVGDRAAIDRSRLGSAAGDLSGGNQQKVLLGRCLARDDIRLLLLDEPTRGVDVGGRSEIHLLIRQAADEGVAVVFASTELDEILDLADVVVTMFAGRTVAVRNRRDVTAESISADMTMSHGSAEDVAAPSFTTTSAPDPEVQA